MIESTTELTLVPKAPREAPTPSAPVRGAVPASPVPAPARPAVRSSGASSALGGLAVQRHAQRLEFTGVGADYFRIWIINLLLTLATLGVYSAWAKRRKARWFARHTLLAGEPFDFHGDPRRILIGRVLAVALLVAYLHVFDGAAVVGLATLGALYAIGPLLFGSVQRFKLANTSWRGMRFGFEADAVTVYASCMPMLVAWTLVSIIGGLGLGPLVDGLAGVALVLLLPLAHGRLKRFQHAHARYGALAFDFKLSLDAFYGLYLRLAAALIVAGAVAGLLGVGLSMGLKQVMGAEVPWLATFLPLGALGVVGVIAWPVYAARLQHLVWHSTRLGEGIEFAYEIPVVPLFKTLLVGGLLTLLTLGLYWPFLAVRLAKLRIEGLTVLSDTPIEAVLVRAPQRRGPGRGAAGDGTAGAFGLDIGW
ncbi:hypothetical protein CDL60_08255 [Roseateles noduli]|nr:hypothetical protein CDL60_08255 [Roseateles noduli]